MVNNFNDFMMSPRPMPGSAGAVEPVAGEPCPGVRGVQADHHGFRAGDADALCADLAGPAGGVRGAGGGVHGGRGWGGGGVRMGVGVRLRLTPTYGA